MARHNMGTIVSFEVKRTLSKTGFWIATLVVPVIMGAVIALIVVSNTSAAAGADQQARAQFTFTYSDASEYVIPAVAEAFGGISVTDDEKSIADVQAGSLDAHFAYPTNPAEEPTKVYAAEAGIFANGKYAAIASEVLIASAQAALDDQSLATLVRGDFQVSSTTFKEGRESAGLAEVIPPLLILLAFYASILLMGNLMATSLLEEKENRVSEMILTTMNPTTMVSGKVVSLFMVGAIQMVAISLPVLVGYLFFREELRLPYVDLASLSFEPWPMLVGALLLVGGFSLVTTTLAAASAIMPTARDAGAIAAPVSIVSFAPLWVGALVLSNPESFVVQILTYFPYTAAPTAMIRNALGTLGAMEATIVIVELFVLSSIIFRIAVRLFQYGSIEYSQKVALKAAFAKHE
ncbi:MAG: ABC transporter permease [Coriobacteriia bacterium]|nr:ABC transporter permease [Coriobacteriia bacterium]MBN2822267.1 ABC transporter permease [Coriobacteriia bacterium]